MTLKRVQWLVCALVFGAIAPAARAATAGQPNPFPVCRALDNGKHLGENVAKDLRRLNDISKLSREKKLTPELITEANRLVFNFNSFIGRAIERRLELPMVVTFVADLDRVLLGFPSSTSWGLEPTLWRARLRTNLLLAYDSVGCIAEGLQLADEALALAASDPAEAAKALGGKGALLLRAGKIRAAVRAFEGVIQAQQSDHSYPAIKSVLAAYNNLGVAARRAGSLSTAADHYRQAISFLDQDIVVRAFGAAVDRGLANQNELESVLATLLVNEGVALTDADAGKDAVVIYSRALAIRRKILRDDDPEIAVVQRNLARQLARMGASAAARIQLNDAIAILVRHPDLVRNYALALAQSGELALAENDSQKAVKDLTEAELRSRAFADLFPLDRANILTQQSRVMQSLGRWIEAEGATTESLRLRRASLPDIHPDLAGELLTLSTIQRANGESSGALASIREAKAIIDRWLEQEAMDCRAGVPPRRSLTSGITEAYLDLLFELRADGKFQSDVDLQTTNVEMFDLIQSTTVDRTGATSLRAAIRQRAPNTEQVRQYETLTRDMCERERALMADLESPSQSTIASLRAREIEGLRQEREKAASLINTSDLTLLRSGRMAIRLDQIRPLLHDKEALIAFRVGTSSSAIAVLASDGGQLRTKFLHAPDAAWDAIALAVERLRSRIGSAPSKEELRLAERDLQSILSTFDPADMLAGMTHIFVVADGPLGRWPVHLLPAGNGLLGDFAPLSTLPSVTALSAVRGQRTSEAISSGYLGIGAPLLHPIDCRRAEALGLATVPAGASNRDVLCLGRIPQAEQIMSRLAGRFTPSRIIAGENATRTAVRQLDFSSIGTLFFATHGLVGDGKEVAGLHEPALVLTPDLAGADDGLLRAQDIVQLKLDNVQLAFIAACNSGAADPSTQEEGFSGLGLSFIFAGARTLIVSHWRVDIAATLALAEGLLDRVAKSPGISVSAALDESMAYLAKDPRFSSPAFWAGFVVVGDGGAHSSQR